MSGYQEVAASIFIRCPQCLGEVAANENDLPATSPFRCRSCRQRQGDIARRFYAQESAPQMRSDEDAKPYDHDSLESPASGKGPKRDRKTQPPTEQ